MPITQEGALNTTALVVPDLYVQIVPPQVLLLNGVPTDIAGIVGTATWGPVNKPTIVGNMQEYAAGFGPVMARKFDMGTAVAIAVQQGAGNFRCVRVTDGTESAATVTVLASVTFTARYPGTLGNSISVLIGNGSAASTYRVTISLPGFDPEVYDNIAGTGSTAFQNMVDAVNNGQGPRRGPSQIVTAALAASPASSVTLGTFPFSAGTPGSDGVSSVTASTLVGTDAAAGSTYTAATGMYALRGQGCGLAMLADADDSTTWSGQESFGLSEGCYLIGTGPAGDDISNAISTKATAGIDSYAFKLMFGDWVYWQDNINKVLRLVSPQAFVLGRLANLSPNQSSLNKPLYGILGTQKSGLPGSAASATFSGADLAALAQAGIDVITNPVPGGSYWGVRIGHNTSSDGGTNGDNYTRMTNYIAATLYAGMGGYVGEPITEDLFTSIRGTLNSFLAGLLNQGLLSRMGGKLPYAVQCGDSNNPPSRTGLGYVQADAQVRYQGINEKFIVNVEGGQTVQVSRQVTQ